MHRNEPFRDKNSKKISGEGAQPPPQLGRGHPLPKPHTLGALTSPFTNPGSALDITLSCMWQLTSTVTHTQPDLLSIKIAHAIFVNIFKVIPANVLMNFLYFFQAHCNLNAKICYVIRSLQPSVFMSNHSKFIVMTSYPLMLMSQKVNNGCYSLISAAEVPGKLLFHSIFNSPYNKTRARMSHADIGNVWHSVKIWNLQAVLICYFHFMPSTPWTIKNIPLCFLITGYNSGITCSIFIILYQ